MRHGFLALALSMTITSGQAESSCYSIELWSVPINQHADNPHIEGCALLQIGTHQALRCGCFETLSEAKQSLLFFQPRFAGAALCKTLRSRFNEHHAPVNLPTQPKPSPTDFALPQRHLLADALHVSERNTPKSSETAPQHHPFEIAPVDPPQWYDALFVEGAYLQQFNGTYATRQYTDYEYTMTLGLDLFKGGLQELKKNRLRTQTQSEYARYQEMAQFGTYRQELYLTDIEHLRNRVEASYATAMNALLDETLKTMHLQLSQLLITRFEVSQKERDHAHFKALKELYDLHQEQNASFPAWIETIEQAHLLDKTILEQRISQLHVALLGEEAKIRLLSLETSYLDYVDMQLHLTHRSVDEVGSYDAVGFKAKLPLTFQRHAETNRYTALQKMTATAQKERTEALLRLQLAEAMDLFEKSRHKIMIAKEQILWLDQAYGDLQTVHQNTIAHLSFSPFNKAYDLAAQRLSFERELYMQRLSMLASLVHIAHLTQTEEPTSLLIH